MNPFDSYMPNKVRRLKDVFCNHWRCSRNFYLLMQLANNHWQVFNACVIPKVAEGCRKMAQSEWVELLDLPECQARLI